MAHHSNRREGRNRDSGEARGVAQLALGVLLIVALLGSWKALRVDTPPPSPADATASGAQSPNTSEPDSRIDLSGPTGNATERAARNHSSLDSHGTQTAPRDTDDTAPCYQGLILPPGWRVLERCFAVASPADAIVQRLRASNLHATRTKTANGSYVVRYQSLSEEEAGAAGEAALAARLPRGLNLYELRIVHDAAIDSYSWQITMPCPSGWRDVGEFRLTAYVLAQERDFPVEPRVQDPCGLEGDYSRPFLFGNGVRMQGSGVTSSGELIHWKGRDCFEILDCPRTALGRCARAGRTIAVDPKVIGLGSEVLVEDIGYRIAEDTGGAIRGQHIDIYYGTELRLRQAWAHSREQRRVCVKPRQMAL